jgi:hypothetical protein
MSMPGFSAESSLYQSNNQYRTTGPKCASDVSSDIVPQGCGWVVGIICGGVIAGGAIFCTGVCIAGGPESGGLPCWLCWTGYLGGLYGFCRDCLPEWVKELIGSFEGGGGSGGGGEPMCCPYGRSCRCGGKCVSQADGSIRCVDGICLKPGQACP